MISEKLTSILIFLALSLISIDAYTSVSKDDKNAPYVMCRSNKIVRTIRVELNEKENSCVAFYTKAGVDREVARAINISSCTRIVDNIKGNLENANWKCREVNKVSMTSSSDE